MNVGIVCGYGVSVENDLESYADSISEFLEYDIIDSLILCGGYTVERSAYSEASLMQQLLRQRGVPHKIFLEELSITSLHNLLFSKEILENYNKPQKIYIFCDSVRSFKIFCLSKIIFNNYSIEIISFGRKEFILVYLIQIPSTILQLLGVVFPKLSNVIFMIRSKWNKIVDKILNR